MKNTLKKLLFLLLAVMSFTVYGQQTLCYDTTGTYEVDIADGPDGTPGSIYDWTVDEPDFAGTINDNGTNSISIDWGTTPVGTYTLTVIETTPNGNCEGDPVTLNVEITAAPNPGDLSATLTTICMGDVAQSVSTDGDTGGTWSSSDDTVLTVDSDGNITPVGAGNATITYTVAGSGGCSDASSTIDISITAAPNAGVLTVVSPICLGDDTQTVTTDGDAGGTWASSNEDVLTVDSDGNITTHSAGNATITYTVIGNGGCTDSVAQQEVTVTDAPNAGTITATSTTICVGDGGEIVSTDGDLGGTWSSSDDLVLTVDSSGNITAVGEGSATITYTITGSGGCSDDSAEIDITIVPVPTTSPISFDP